ncbi:MAG: gliding motility-associated protein GldE [Bacteroidales bacterium]|nr:gliding motility-associated protein GldE [Bacteroidales bacterium]MCK4638101.1 gliding motility-associated protein GldE [Bacteroidales bacterium]
MEDPDIESYLTIIFYLLDSIIKSFTFGTVINFLIVFMLLFFSAMISGTEIAFFSLTPAQLNEIKTSTAKKNILIIRLLESPKRLLATILIANNFINVAIVIFSTYITTKLFNLTDFPVLAFVIQVIVITALILFIGEIMPKIYATQFSVRFAKIMAIPLQILIKIFYPLSSVLVRSTSVIDKRLSKRKYQISMNELSDAIDITSGEDVAGENTKILKGIVKFGDIEVKEIMKSRTDVTAIDTEINFKKLLEIILESGYSRIPAYDETFDNIKGILYIKDLLPHLGKDKNFKWQDLLRPAFYVPENKKINDLLKEFQEKKIHLAIVVDEYGGTSGIVTLEDILEEIVGDISDEFDIEDDEFSYKKLDDNNYIFEGKTTLIDFCKIIKVEYDIFDEVKGDPDSLAGVILELEGKIPDKDTSVTFRDFIFKIISVDKRRIKQIKVTIKKNVDKK